MGGLDPNGEDVLDLRDLLVGEHRSNWQDYLNFSFDGTNTTINVSTTGNLYSTGYDQVITLEGVDLVNGETNQNTLINTLLTQGKLLVDT